MSSSRSVALIPHPASRSTAVRSIDVRVSRSADAKLSLAYTLEGDLDRLRIPTSAPPRFTDGLWQHTCCEVFVRRSHGPMYHELNLSPSGAWAAYAFERYRDGAPLMDEALAPQIAVCRAEDRLVLDAVIRLDRLSPRYALERLSLAIAAVIEDDAGAPSYWALAHPAGKPDFHHADAFALELDDV